MPRALTLGNGRLHLNLDEACSIVDLYYPHVGSEHHAGTPSRLGVWADGQFAWLGAFERHLRYAPEALTTEVRAVHQGLQLELRLRDAVDSELDVMVREIELHDLAGRRREVRVFVHHDLDIGGTDVGDTAFYDPELSAVIHYKGSRYFLVNGRAGRDSGVHQFTCGRAGIHGYTGTWADAEDGVLSRHPIEQGAVDSCVGYGVGVAAHGTETLWSWLCVATAYREVVALDRTVRERHPRRIVDRTRRYWQSWVAQTTPLVAGLPERVHDLYSRSLLVARALCDRDGGVIAATDRDIMSNARDTYCYVWPRDGALVGNALARAGHHQPLRAFLRFCADRFGGGRGYLLHKFLPDGALGSSWHPWFAGGKAQIPIQEDETALVVWALGAHLDRRPDREFLAELYRRVVEPAADWMASWRDWRTALPLPSWDLWEERRGVHAYTVASVHAGLRAASELAVQVGDIDKATHWAAAADEIRQGADEHLLDPRTGCFARQLVPRQDGSGYDRDMTVDASLMGLWAFGMYPPGDARIRATMDAVRDRLWVRTGTGGFARYERDHYQSVGLGDQIPGNPWVICTLWVADWLALTAVSVDDLDAAVLPLLEWVCDRASPAGLLPEQCHPQTGAPMSVSPLTWSHAAFVDSCLTYRARREELLRDAVDVEADDADWADWAQVSV